MKTPDNTVPVWDPIVRISHWALVIAFFVAYFTEDDFLTQHVWAGYVVGTVVCLRLIWGFVGSGHARFSEFVRSPAATMRYLRDLIAHRASRYVGHNPAGGAMIVALLVTLSGTVGTGLVLYAVDEGAGPLAGWVSAEGTASSRETALSSQLANDESERTRAGAASSGAREEFWEEAHEFFVNLTLLLVLLHILGVLHGSYVDKENLVKAMITGRKRAAKE